MYRKDSTGFTSVIVSIILVTIMIGLPQIKASKNVRNMSTVIYLCHPCIMVIINLSDHLGIFLNAGVKSFQISDLTYNTLGGAVGGVIYYLGYSRRRKK